jgi:putative DNA methylase
MTIKSPKKLIEVALPLDDINTAAAREKSIRHGHPSTLHLWWARRPLAAARAVLFAQMVNDPGGERGYKAGLTKEQANAKREKLFEIIRELVKWENTNNEEVLERARADSESWRETCEMNKGKPGFDPDKLPAFHDPFAGGGAIPLEAQRLGLEAHASDLNPVAVLINKAMIEIPPKFAGQQPVGPEIQADKTSKKKSSRDAFEDWSGARGLAEDVRRYGHWMREEAFKRIGHLYPPMEITQNMVDNPDNPRPDLQQYVGRKLTVIAWLWARTVKSPNPAYRPVDVPLVSNFMLSTKKGKEAYVEPVVEGDSYRFEVRIGKPANPEAVKAGTTAGKRKAFNCLISGSPIDYKHIRSEGKAGRMGERLLAIVCEGDRGRVYLSPTKEMESIAHCAEPQWKPETPLPDNTRDFKTPNYGMTTYGDLFTPRQLVALNTFSDLIAEARERARTDALAAGLPDDPTPLHQGGSGAAAYGDAVSTFLAIAMSRLTDICNSLCRWEVSKTQVRNLFGRQAIPMMWDFAENNVFGLAAGDYSVSLGNMIKALEKVPAKADGYASQADAQTQRISSAKLISTDPPYYDNIGYADLSDFFYVWLRRALKEVHPGIFSTLSVPKAEELVATPYRHGGKEQAEGFFMDGMTGAMNNLAETSNAAFPVTIYYAFKQAEKQGNGDAASTGWETFLEAVLKAGFAITGTWPMRTELGNRMIGSGTNALASSIVLVCRPRETTAESISRKDFQRRLRAELPEALETMIGGKEGEISPIAPVDLAQAAIGPGMAVYSRYSAVLEADGSPMKVREALILINRVVDEYFNEAGEELDADTRFCIDWFSTHGWKTGKFGEADTLARAKGTSVEGVHEAGVVEAGGGKVRLLKWKEYPGDWDPETDKRLPTWEGLHHLIRALNENGEAAAGQLLADMPERGESLRQLAYRLYTLCERKKWAEDARAYNEIIQAWGRIVEESAALPAGTQSSLEI